MYLRFGKRTLPRMGILSLCGCPEYKFHIHVVVTEKFDEELLVIISCFQFL